MNLLDAKPMNNPCTAGLYLQPATEQEAEEFKKLGKNYQSPIGPLNFIATLARPNISFAVSNLARFSENPIISHWKEVKHIWRYLLKTIKYQLVFRVKTPAPQLVIYSDATCGDNPVSQLSQTGFICLFKGSPIYWTSRQQRSIAHSSTESECNALSAGHLEGRWINHLICEIWRTSNLPPVHLIENKGLNDKIKKFSCKSHAKYIDIKLKILRNDWND